MSLEPEDEQPMMNGNSTGAEHGGLAAAFCMAALLAACGGGGGGGGAGPVSAPPPKSQSIAFAQAGPVYRFAGDAAYANLASGGGGAGAISYSSDTTAVATVDSQSG